MGFSEKISMIIRYVSIFLLFVTSGAGAADKPTFFSQIDGVSIGNASILYSQQGTVIRGRSPDKKLHELQRLGITDILIIKNETKDEVRAEIEALKKRGFPESHIKHIPFQWKDLPDYQTSCTQMVEALTLLVEVAKNPKRKVYFHCTVGEDRTGLLAGLFRVLVSNWTPEEAFFKEMCENGYEAGNPYKPKHVVDPIRRELTPLFFKMAYLIDKKILNVNHMNPSVCSRDPITSPEFKKFTETAASKYNCKPSSRIPSSNPR